MKRWSFIAGAALIVLGVFALLQVGLDAVGIHFRIWWIFWPLVLIGIGVWIVTGISRGRCTGQGLRPPGGSHGGEDRRTPRRRTALRRRRRAG